MSSLIQQSTAGDPLFFFLVQSADHISALTGATPTVTISKNGAAFAAPAGAVSEIANGWYQVAGNATDTNTLGALLLHATAASGDPTDEAVAQIVAFNPRDAVHLGLSALPNTACTSNASLLTSGTGTDQVSVTAGRVDLGKTLGTAVTLDTNNVLNVSAKYLAGTALTGRDIGASVLLSAGTGTGQISLAAGDVTVGTNADKTGYALAVAPPTLSAIVDGVWDEQTSLHTSAGSLAKAVETAGSAGDPWSTSLPGAYGAGTAGFLVGTYVNASVSAIKAKTDSLTFTVAGVVDSNITDWKGATAPAMTGDAYARLGAPAGASVSADVAAVKGDTGTILTDVNAGAGAIFTSIATLKADLDAGVTVAGYASGQDPMTLVLKTAFTESYAALHAVPTGQQLLFELRSLLAEKTVSGTTLTTRKIDGATTAETFTLNDPTNPTAITRAS